MSFNFSDGRLPVLAGGPVDPSTHIADIEVSMGFDTRVMAYFIRFEKWVPGKVAYFRFRWSAMVCLEEAILGGLLRWHVEYEREVAKYGKV